MTYKEVYSPNPFARRTRTNPSGPSIHWARRVLDEARRAERLRQLPELCAMLTLGLYNQDNDPRPLFRGLQPGPCIALAGRFPAVLQAMDALPSDWRWTE